MVDDPVEDPVDDPVDAGAPAEDAPEEEAAGADPVAGLEAEAAGVAVEPPAAGVASLATGVAAGSLVLAAPVPLSRKSVTYQPDPLS